MEILLLLAKFIPLLALLFSFYKLNYGFALYFIYFCLFPTVTMTVVPFSLLGIVFFSLSIYRYKTEVTYGGVLPYLILQILLLLFVPFHNDVPSSWQIHRVQAELLCGVFYAFALANIVKNESYTIILRTMIGVMIICCLYALFLTTMSGINPYVMFFELQEGKNINDGWLAADDRIFGRISSTFCHPMKWAFFLGLSLIFTCFLFVREKKSKNIYYFLIPLLLISAVFCGVRSVLAALFLSFCYFLIRKGKVKLIFYFLVSFVLFLLLVSLIPSVSDYLFSIVDFRNKSGNVSGSDMDMRLNQLEGAFDEISTCYLFGHGNDWCTLYALKNGNHPILLGFESLFFMVLCENGLLGFIVWVLFGISLLILPRFFMKKVDYIWAECLVVFYFAFALATGDYEYLRFFYIFYIMILALSCRFEKERKIRLLTLLLVGKEKNRKE